MEENEKMLVPVKGALEDRRKFLLETKRGKIKNRFKKRKKKNRERERERERERA